MNKFTLPSKPDMQYYFYICLLGFFQVFFQVFQTKIVAYYLRVFMGHDGVPKKDSGQNMCLMFCLVSSRTSPIEMRRENPKMF